MTLDGMVLVVSLYQPNKDEQLSTPIYLHCKSLLCTGLHSFLEDPYGIEPIFHAPTTSHTIAFQTVQRFSLFFLLCGFLPKNVLMVQKMHLQRATLDE